ncbi:YfjI family protein [Brucella sp. 21LCYQ03]|nr:YfjI family protein [Brucella sp. 21LCYQ03]
MEISPQTGSVLSGNQHFELWKNPVPISSSLPAIEAFVPELLPAALRDYVFDVADRQQSVPDFVAVAALCGLASLIGNRIRVAPKQLDDWIEVPNLWGAVIGPPSAMKTPAMQKALGPVYAIQDDMRKQWQADLKAADIDDVLGKIEVREATKAAAKAYKTGDKDGARAILADVSKEDEDEQPCPRIVVNDATVEKLGELLNENPRGLLLVRDELPGFLSQMESEEHASDRAFYLEAFNGSGQFTYDRIGRGTVHIANCTVSIIGGVQPSRIAPIVRGAITGTSNDGLIQRLQLTVWPDPRTSWQWVDRHPDRAARETYEKVFRDIHELDLGGSDNPVVFRLSPDAQAMFQQWMQEIQTDARSGKLSTVLESHLLKMPKTIASLALIFELVEGGRAEVGTDAMALALGWADYLRSHANRLYSSGNTIVVEDGARLILERRDTLPDEFTVRDVQRKGWQGLTDRDAVGASIDLLEETNHCHKFEKRTGATGGRPTASYCWNPKIREAK